MHDGSQYFDVILFAMVAVFLALRLRSVLGRRTGNERPPRGLGPAPAPKPAADSARNVIRLPGAQAAQPATPLDAMLQRIHDADAAFSPDSFLSGAAAAFEMIVGAFASGDEATLRPLLSDEVFHNFAAAIRARAEAREICANKLLGIDSVDFADAEYDGKMARITVRFASRQIVAVKDAAGKIVEGDLDHDVKVVDLWTFARDPRSRNPNWLLVATNSHDE
jgi:predicted lipid-binding transport protein (Tim44 family)